MPVAKKSYAQILVCERKWEKNEHISIAVFRMEFMIRIDFTFSFFLPSVSVIYTSLTSFDNFQSRQKILLTPKVVKSDLKIFISLSLLMLSLNPWYVICATTKAFWIKHKQLWKNKQNSYAKPNSIVVKIVKVIKSINLEVSQSGITRT